MKTAPFLVIHSPSRRYLCIAGIVFLLLTLMVRAQALPIIGSSFIGGYERDAGLYIWLFQTALPSLLSGSWFSTPAFYPYGNSLAWSDNFILPSAIGYPLMQAGVSLPIAYNSILLLALFLNGLATWQLAYTLTGRQLPSLTAGTLFLTYSGINGHTGHPQLQFAFFLPVALRALLLFFASPTFRNALSLGCCLTLAFLTTVYYSLFIVVEIVALWAGFILLKPNHIRLRHLLTFAGGFGIPLFFLFILFVLPYIEVKNAFGPRALYEAFEFRATGASYFSASPFNLFYGFTHGFSHDEAHLFPGLIAYLLAGFALTRLSDAPALARILVLLAILTIGAGITSQDPNLYLITAIECWGALLCTAVLLFYLGKLERRLNVDIVTNRDVVALMLCGCLTAAVLSLGPLGISTLNQASVGPFALVHSLPGFDSLRAIGRLGFLVVLFIAVMAAYGCIHVERFTGNAQWITIMLLIGILAENYHKTLPIEAPPTTPEIIQSTAEAPERGAVLFLPFTPELNDKQEVKSWSDFAKLNVHYMLWDLQTKKPTVNGYSGIRSRLMLNYPASTARFPDNQSLKALKRIGGLRYIVYMNRFARTPLRESDLTTLPPDLTLISRDSEGNLLFRWDDTQEIKDRSIYVPPYPEGVLSFRMRATRDTALQNLSIKIEIGEKHPVSRSVSLAADAAWHPLSVPLTHKEGIVRPLLLKIRSADDGPVEIQNISVSPLPLYHPSR